MGEDLQKTNANPNNEPALEKPEVSKEVLEKVREVIIHISIVLSQVRMYGIGHKAVTNALEKLDKGFKEFCAKSGPLEIGLTADTILYRQQIVPTNSQVLNRFCLLLHQRGVGVIVFNPELEPDEWFSFFKFVNSNEFVSSDQPVQSLLEEKNILSILVGELDLSELHEDEETEEDKKIKEKWLKIFNKVADQGFKAIEKEVYNELGTDLKKYGKVIKRAIEEFVKEHPRGKTVWKEISYETFLKKKIQHPLAPAIFNVYQNMLKKLEIGAKQVLLENKDLSPKEKEFLAETILSDMVGDELALTICSLYWNKELDKESKKNIYLTLSKFEDLIAGALKIALKSIKDEGQRVGEKTPDTIIALDAHFRMKKVPVFLPVIEKEFNKTLEAIQETPSFSIFNWEYSLEDSYLERDYALVLIAMFKMERDKVKYKAILDELSAICKYSVLTGDLKLFEDVFDAMLSGLRQKNIADEQYLKETLAGLTAKGTVTEMIQALKDWGKDKLDSIRHILAFTSGEGVQTLLQSMFDEEDRAIRSQLKSIILEKGDELLPHLKKFVNHSTWYIRRNTLNIYADLKMGVDDYKHLLEDNNEKVRHEAFKAVYASQHPRMLNFIKLGIKDLSEPIKHLSILRIVDLPSTKETVEILAKYLELQKIDSRTEHEIENILYHIGSSGLETAIPVLEKYLKGQGFFKRGTSEKLQIASVGALSYIRSSRSKEILTKLAVGKDDDLKMAALVALKEMENG